MKSVFAIALILVGASAGAQTMRRDYPSCDLAAQHAVKGDVGGSINDARQAHVSVRANLLEADIGNARKARRLTGAQASTLFKRVEAVRHATDGFVKKQGFLSAAERASYDRELDAVAMRVCGTARS